MKYLALCSCLMLAAVANQISAQDQDPWKKYEPRTLGQIIKLHAAKVFDNPDILMTFSDGSVAVLTNDSFPSKVKVIYTGRSSYVAWVGARKESDRVDWVFLVNEFEKE